MSTLKFNRNRNKTLKVYIVTFRQLPCLSKLFHFKTFPHSVVQKKLFKFPAAPLKKRNRWSSALHIPWDSGSGPAEVPALPSPDYDCTVGPSPDLFPTADPRGFGSPCPHPWSYLGTRPYLHIKTHSSVWYCSTTQQLAKGRRCRMITNWVYTP